MDGKILKKDIISFVSELELKNKLTVKDSETIVNSIFEFLKQKMKEGNEIQISDFGKFLVVNKDAREGINPITGEKISIVAKKSPKIKFFPSFKKFLND
jgi:DNA-binding protein HU-beta